MLFPGPSRRIRLADSHLKWPEARPVIHCGESTTDLANNYHYELAQRKAVFLLLLWPY